MCPSGQRDQTVNLTALAFGGSNPPAPMGLQCSHLEKLLAACGCTCIFVVGGGSVHLCRGGLSTVEFDYGSCIFVSSYGYRPCVVSNPRSCRCRPASRGRRDAGWGFISSQSIRRGDLNAATRYPGRMKPCSHRLGRIRAGVVTGELRQSPPVWVKGMKATAQ